jgi:thymidine phosphorylase
MEDTVDHSVGFVITVKPGDRVKEGEPVASIFARDSDGIAIGQAALGDAIRIGESGRLTDLITHRVTSRGVEPLGRAG